MWAIIQTVPLSLPFFLARILDLRIFESDLSGTSTLSMESKPSRQVMRKSARSASPFPPAAGDMDGMETISHIILAISSREPSILSRIPLRSMCGITSEIRIKYL